MGGKQKQAQRTKNNVRPSSSGRSAEFLGNNAPHLLTFSGIKNVGLSLAPVDEFDSTVDTSFQLVFKKLNKKDAITKLKALNELTELIVAAEPDVVKSILPLWSRVYGVLATDMDHKVREATHVAHNKIVLKVKRNLAPYLKLLIGPWFTSKYDAYAPAATAANSSFQDAFSENKLQEAVVFCQEEILNYIYENLITQSFQNTSKHKTTAEDCKAKNERLLISSLSGYSLYLTTVTKEAIQKVEAANMNIISNATFWKLSKYDLAQVRAAWFSVISSVCQKAPFLLASETTNLTKSIFNNLDDDDPVVHSSLWDSALLVVSSTEWSTSVNIEEILKPKLTKILRQAGFGNASTIYPNLLPLISKLPASISLSFFSKFFETMREGFGTVKSSQAESRAISISFIECFQYVIFKYQGNIEFCDSLINNQLIPIIDMAITNFQPANKTLYNQLSSLSQYWNKNKSNIINYKHYFNAVWNLIHDLLKRQMSSLKYMDIDELRTVLERQIDLILSLKHVAKSKKKMKVKFDSDGTNPSDVDIKLKSDDQLDDSYLLSLSNIAVTVCTDHIKMYNSENNAIYLNFISTLMFEFESKDFYCKISSTLQPENNETNCIKSFCFDFVIKWIKDSKFINKSTVNLLFLLLKYIDVEDKREIMEVLNKIENEECLGYCIASALKYPYNADPIFKDWLREETVEQFLITVNKHVATNNDNSDYTLLLKQAFTENENQDLLISDNCIKEITTLTCKFILNFDEHKDTIDSLASFASHLSTVIYTEKFKLKYGDELLLTLFNFSCNSSLGNEFLSSDTLWEVNTSWQDSLTILTDSVDRTQIKEIAEKAAKILEPYVTVGSLPNENISNRISEKIICFNRSVYKSNQLLVGELLNIFLNQKFIEKWSNQLASLCNDSDYIRGFLTSPFKKIESIEVNITEEEIAKYLIWKVIVVKVICNTLEDDSFNNDKVNEDYFYKVLDTPEDIILDLLLSLCIGKSVIRNFKNMKYIAVISKFCQVLKMNFQSLLNNLDTSFKNKLKEDIKNYISTKSWLYASVAYEYYVEMEKLPTSKMYEELLTSSTEKIGKLHLTQVFAEDLSYDNIAIEKLSSIERIITLKCLAHNQEIDVQIAEVFGTIEKLRDEVPEGNFNNITFSNWEQTQICIEIMNLCAQIIDKRKVANLSTRHWDFIVISLSSWSAKLNDIKHKYMDIQIAAFISSTSKLFVSICKYINELQQENVNIAYIQEWHDIFLPSITTNLMKTWLFLAGELLDVKVDVMYHKVPSLEDFGKFITFLNPKYIFQLQPDGMPKWSKILHYSCSLLTSHLYCLQLWGYQMLLKIASELTNIDSVSLQNNTPHKKGMIFGQFNDLLIKAQDIVHTMLIDFRFGEDSCTVQPFTDSYTYTLSYLLIWDILLILCEKSSTELKFQYSEWLRSEGLLSSLLTNIFKLMPVEVLSHSKNVSKVQRDWFLSKKILDFEDDISSENIERLVCWIFKSTLSQLPASVRNWWSSVDSKTALLLERVTTEFISPYLCKQELNNITAHQNQFKNMTVKVHSSLREVVAAYTIEDSQIELSITLPLNYPLSGPDVQCNEQITGICHKQWIKQLRLAVLHQNCSIWDALLMWNNILDKKFDNVEECYICFAILHPGTYQLPKMACKTCRKKFHAACLYKWISTSQKSSCPICRNLF